MSNDVLKRVRIALGLIEGETSTEDPKVEVAMAVEAILLDGTKIGADAFEPGNPLFVIAEDGTQSPAPEGTHETADLKITVDANGIIAAVEPKTVEVAAEDVATGVPSVDPESEVTMAKVLMALESIVTEMGNMKTKMEEIETKIGSTEEKVEAFAKAPGAERIKNAPASLHAFAKSEVSAFDKKLELLKEIKKGLNK